MQKIAVLVGSLRRDSLNLRFAKALEKLSEGRFAFEFAELGDVPMYNEDLWENVPAGVTRLNATVEAADAVLFVTPEYNRSYPAVIKNAIDWGSRPYGKSSWAGKACGIIGTSPGAMGAAVAQNELRNIATVVGMIVMGQPEVYFQFRPDGFDGDTVVDEKSKTFLAHYIDAFEAFIARTAQPKPHEQPDARPAA